MPSCRLDFSRVDFIGLPFLFLESLCASIISSMSFNKNFKWVVLLFFLFVQNKRIICG